MEQTDVMHGHVCFKGWLHLFEGSDNFIEEIPKHKTKRTLSVSSVKTFRLVVSVPRTRLKPSEKRDQKQMLSAADDSINKYVRVTRCDALHLGLRAAVDSNPPRPLPVYQT